MTYLQIANMLADYHKECEAVETLREKADVQFKHARLIREALRQPLVSGSFMCAHGAENRCKEQCYTCSEDEKCDARYSYKATMIHYFQFTEWIAERYNFIGGEWCCWCAKQYDIKDTERYKDTGELWAYWWENCR